MSKCRRACHRKSNIWLNKVKGKWETQYVVPLYLYQRDDGVPWPSPAINVARSLVCLSISDCPGLIIRIKWKEPKFYLRYPATGWKWCLIFLFWTTKTLVWRISQGSYLVKIVHWEDRMHCLYTITSRLLIFVYIWFQNFTIFQTNIVMFSDNNWCTTTDKFC